MPFTESIPAKGSMNETNRGVHPKMTNPSNKVKTAETKQIQS
ncbi:MAG: hypothetical protein N0C88_17720 [Candidatus Thiodiazotropha lotti]|nr:hypothetical protein [Candidatus Thiodiazotropha lotti]